MTLCLIGCGAHARQVYLPALQRLSRERSLALAGCCDLDEARAEAMRREAGFARNYTDYRVMLAAERPQAVILVTPYFKTAEVAGEVCAQGCHVLIEKPPGATLAQCRSILEAAQRAGVIHQVAFNRRHMPLVKRLGQVVRETGRIQNIQYTMCRTNRTEDFFFVTAVHGIDYVRFVAGSDYEEVRFRYQPLPALGEGVMNIYMDCSFASGATAQLAFLVMSGTVHERMMVTCDHATVYGNLPIWQSSDSPGTLSRWRGDTRELYESGSDLCDTDELYVTNGFYREVQAFLECVEAGTPSPDSLESALQVVELGECIAGRREAYRR